MYESEGESDRNNARTHMCAATDLYTLSTLDLLLAPGPPLAVGEAICCSIGTIVPAAVAVAGAEEGGGAPLLTEEGTGGAIGMVDTGGAGGTEPTAGAEGVEVTAAVGAVAKGVAVGATGPSLAAAAVEIMLLCP